MLFNEIDNFMEVYNNSVIELEQCFGTSFFGRIDFRPNNSVPKHCIRSITYNYVLRKLIKMYHFWGKGGATVVSKDLRVLRKLFHLKEIR